MSADRDDLFADIDSLYRETFGNALEAEEAEAFEPQVAVRKTYSREFAKRIASELALEKEIDWQWEDGCAYHCMSFGDIDSLSYLRFALRQQRLEYAILSTWAMAVTDIEEIGRWHERGMVGRMDFYVGEIFTARYSGEYSVLRPLAKRMGGRACMFRNHSKVMVGFGDRFDFVIESSANVNTNPRAEQTVITLNPDLARFYKAYFDDIKPFNRDDCAGWSPYVLRRDRDGQAR